MPENLSPNAINGLGTTNPNPSSDEELNGILDELWKRESNKTPPPIEEETPPILKPTTSPDLSEEAKQELFALGLEEIDLNKEPIDEILEKAGIKHCFRLPFRDEASIDIVTAYLKELQIDFKTISSTQTFFRIIYHTYFIHDSFKDSAERREAKYNDPDFSAAYNKLNATSKNNFQILILGMQTLASAENLDLNLREKLEKTNIFMQNLFRTGDQNKEMTGKDISGSFEKADLLKKFKLTIQAFRMTHEVLKQIESLALASSEASTSEN